MKCDILVRYGVKRQEATAFVKSEEKKAAFIEPDMNDDGGGDKEIMAKAKDKIRKRFQDHEKVYDVFAEAGQGGIDVPYHVDPDHVENEKKHLKDKRKKKLKANRFRVENRRVRASSSADTCSANL